MPRRRGRWRDEEETNAPAGESSAQVRPALIANIRPNPGIPPLSIEVAASQLEQLWPLDRVVARWLGCPADALRTRRETLSVGLLDCMLREGCRGWRREAGFMYNDIRLRLRNISGRFHFLDSPEGGVVFWLWTLGEHLRGEEIVALLGRYVTVYYPFVHQTSVSAITALAACERVQDVCRRRGLRSVQTALHGAG